jgi:predicted ATPase
MLTRLKVSGFKNLVDVDVRFGPFTCIAGANGVGKSNLFDAIRFLSAIADRPLIEAALSVRDDRGRTSDVRSLFHRVGDEYGNEISFEAEMIVPHEGVDDLGQKATASITFLRYSIIIWYKDEDNVRSSGTLQILKEELVHINQGEATKHLLFTHKPSWRKSAILGRRTSPFISTGEKEGNRVIELHQDGSKGRPLSRLAASLPRTVLSVANAAESPTVLLARREMQSWRLLQLEPTALRQPSELTAATKLGMDGANLPATLYSLARFNKEDLENGKLPHEVEAQVYAQIANRLAELIEDVKEVGVDRDDRRELLTLMVTGRDGTSHPARSLSDGTLRFLALAVLASDPEAQGILCLEEPENGIHPERIPAMLKLLQDIATDVNEPVSLDNPLRQVIINTHSPSVVSQVPHDSLLVAELKQTVRFGQRFKRVCFSALSDTWREKDSSVVNVASRGKLLAYLNPVTTEKLQTETEKDTSNKQNSKHTQYKERRVVDREDVQELLLFPTE